MQPKVIEITENYVKLHRTLSDLMGAPIFNYKCFDFYSNPDSHWFTRIILKGSLSPSELIEEVEDLRKKGFHPDILDFLNTRDHEDSIRKLGYNSCNEQAGMYLKGNPIPSSRFKTSKNSNIQDEATSEALEIRKIKTPSELKDWLKIVNDSFESDDRENLYLKLIDQTGFRLYAGFVNGSMATTGMTFFDGESYGLYSITTGLQHRGFGYASILVEHILGEIRKEFSGFIILHATEMGKGIYERFGFEKSILLRHWSHSGV
ncbi:GNAT family N-acetyltransferase [Leptospira barantonii]|uniref:GNAT family N-acetyltransferase n=1 Tax=Leptospira barantonii TaxID=2023184 RepID=A0ABX4NUD1_9LEPT|nr:GNAT family N-acetyltransferase [Leptospira barantonii]PJZ58653.1 GNAT family N-acetyltransferase [Leptospira barantonii]